MNSHVTVHEGKEPNINDQKGYGNMNNKVTVHEGKEPNVNDQISYGNMNNQVTFHEGREPNINDQISHGNMNNQVTKKGNPMRYACEECQEDWNSMDDLKKHLAENHPGVQGELKIKVSHGITTIKFVKNLAETNLAEAPLHSSSVHGGSGLNSQYEYKRHMYNVHEKNKPFQCISCPTRFAFKNDLERHFAEAHEGEEIDCQDTNNENNLNGHQDNSEIILPD